MKNTILFLYLLAAVACQAQPSSPYAPESGAYAGSIFSLSAAYRYGYSPIGGFGLQSSTTANSMPSPLGELLITNKGNNRGSYAFSKTDWKGDWTFDENTRQLAFTGPLAGSIQNYQTAKGWYSIQLVVRSSDSETVGYTYARKASRPFPKLTTPNGALNGTITFKPDYNSLAYFDLRSGTVRQIPETLTASTNAAGLTVSVGYVNDPHHYQIDVLRPDGQLRQRWDGATVAGFQWSFHDYNFAILSPQADRIALLGKTPASYGPDFSYTPAQEALAIVDLKGQLLGKLPLDAKNYSKPAFLKDGRLLYCPAGGGLALTDAGYRPGKLIYGQQINCFALSPDERQIAFSEGVYFYVMELADGQIRQLNSAGEAISVNSADEVLDLVWSPDGSCLGLCLRSIGSNSIVLIPLDGSPYSFLRDEQGDPQMCWSTTISWY